MFRNPAYFVNMHYRTRPAQARDILQKMGDTHITPLAHQQIGFGTYKWWGRLRRLHPLTPPC